MAIKIQSTQGFFLTKGGAKIEASTMYVDTKSSWDFGAFQYIPLNFQTMTPLGSEAPYTPLGVDLAGIGRERVTLQELAELVGNEFSIFDINPPNIQQVIANRWQASNPDWSCTVEFPPLT